MKNAQLDKLDPLVRTIVEDRLRRQEARELQVQRLAERPKPTVSTSADPAPSASAPSSKKRK